MSTARGKEKCKNKIDRAEVEIEVRGSYFPTMKLLDLPGLISGSTDNEVSSRSSSISSKYLKMKNKQSTILCDSLAGDVSTIGGALRLAKRKKKWRKDLA